MLPERVSNTGPLTYESGALPFALRGPAGHFRIKLLKWNLDMSACHIISCFIKKII